MGFDQARLALYGAHLLAHVNDIGARLDELRAARNLDPLVASGPSAANQTKAAHRAWRAVALLNF